MTLSERRKAIRKIALQRCYDSGMFDTPAEVDANANHPIVRAAWEGATAAVDGELTLGSKE